MSIEIKSWDGRVLFTSQVETVREALEEAVRARANLAGANLARVNLAGANLAGANLAGANLARVNLEGANLEGAYLVGAYLVGANLVGANLARANLADAYLVGANLVGANLARANLVGAYLADAIGVGDWAKVIRDDIRKVLDAAPHEVDGLLAAMWAGKVDGSTYSGECACLVGTIANVRGVAYDDLGIDLRPDSTRPAERWFLRIRKGDTPVTNPSAAFAAAVIAQWQMERANARPKKRRPPHARGTEGGNAK